LLGLSDIGISFLWEGVSNNPNRYLINLFQLLPGMPRGVVLGGVAPWKNFPVKNLKGGPKEILGLRQKFPLNPVFTPFLEI
jgi:hypothetical protein